MKLTVSKSKNSASFYVQKTIRKPNGSVTTVTIEKLGNLAEVTAKAGGKDPYVWAQEYVNELNRREYDENKEILVSYSPSRLLKKGEQKLFNCGYLFLQKIYYQMGVDKICRDISSRHSFEYDLNDVLSKLIYARLLFPSSKLSSNKQARKLIEQPSFELHDIYRALSVLSEENDFIQARLYKNSQKVIERRKDILYYDCTNYFFELEEADSLRRYGKSKQHQPLPIVGMGLFMDYDGIPLAFDIYPGNKNEQPTLKPLEKKVIRDYGMEQLVVCTDAGLSSKANRRFNDKTVDGVPIRSFITTQSVKQLPEYLKEFALDPEGWHLPGTSETFRLNEIDEAEDVHKVFYRTHYIVNLTFGTKGIHVIKYRYKTDAEKRKYLLNIFLGFKVTSSETAQIFNDNTVDLFVFYIIHHTIEVRTLKVRSCFAVIGVNIYKLYFRMLGKVITDEKFLIFQTLAFFAVSSVQK